MPFLTEIQKYKKKLEVATSAETEKKEIIQKTEEVADAGYVKKYTLLMRLKIKL